MKRWQAILATGLFATATAIVAIFLIIHRKKKESELPTVSPASEETDAFEKTQKHAVRFTASLLRKTRPQSPTGRFVSHFAGANYLGTTANPFAVAISPIDRSIRSLDLHPDCTEIAVYAFENCEKLESVTIPSGLSTVGFGAFGGCTSLDRVEISDLAAWCKIDFNCRAENYSANPLCYADKLIINGENAIEIEIPEGVKSLPCCAFSTSGLKSITLPSTLTEIGSFAFDNCYRLQSICIPASVKRIGASVFYGCIGLREITVQDGNPVYHASGNCLIKTKAQALVAGCAASEIPDDGSVISIDAQAFSGCERLSKLVVPASITSIGASAFFGCTDLKELSIALHEKTSHLGEIFATDSDLDRAYFVPRKLKNITLTGEEIPAWSMRECDGLVHATIGATVNRIGAGAFEGCTRLTNVVFETPDGWTANETAVSADELANPSAAATYLTKTYSQNAWERK